MNILCTGNYRKERYFDILNIIAKYFEPFDGYKIFLTDDFKNKVETPSIHEGIEVIDFSKFINDADIVLSIGGDGTILSTVRRLRQNIIPVLGIHIGGLGFLAQSTAENLLETLEHIRSKNYSIDERILLNIMINKGNDGTFYALNDAVIDHGDSGRVLKTKLYISNKHLNNYESDGIIVSTPTGSTGYSLSSGGPIISPNLNLLAITPICSHSLSARPIVLPSDSFINIKFTDDFVNASLTIDGQERLTLNKETIVSICKAKYSANLIRLPFNDYLSTLKDKLHWSGNSREF